MFSESHNKSALEQMAGRVRGNPETGTGLYDLVVVYDAEPHPSLLSYVEQEFDRLLLDHVETVMEDHKKLIEAAGKKYSLSADIAAIQKNHHYLRYDPIAESFQFYGGREKCYQQERRDQNTFTSLMEQLYDHMYYEFISPTTEISVTGGYELSRTWFPYSRVYHSPDAGTPPLEKAVSDLLSFLKDNAYLEVKLDIEKQNEVMIYVHSLIQKYGQKELGFGRTLPVTLKPAMARFGLEVESAAAHSSRDKIIHGIPATEWGKL